MYAEYEIYSFRPNLFKMYEDVPCNEVVILKAVETIHCRGHPNITGTHKSTFEITKEPEVTKKGTCIIGVSSDKGSKDLSREFKKILADERSELTAVFEIGGSHFHVRSSGSAGITLEHETDIVWRRSCFVCGRTVGIYSDCTAELIPRDIIKKIREGGEITVTLTARLNPEAPSPSVPHLPDIFHSPEESPCHACKE
jgi:uncharacterized protein